MPRATKCASNLRQIAMGFFMYATDNKGLIIPAYNLPLSAAGVDNTSATSSQIMEGFPCILVRDGYITGASPQDINTVFYCPDTADVFGVGAGQTGTDQVLPNGYTDWPMVFPSGGGDGGTKVGMADPADGYNNIIRCSYWLNAYNPIGGEPAAAYSATDIYYTTSVGYGNATYGYLRQHRMTDVRDASFTITLADGVYMGRQSSSNIYTTATPPAITANRRIGYRHPGQYGTANVGFADGHVETVGGMSMPRTGTAFKAQNEGGPTFYQDPIAVYGN